MESNLNIFVLIGAAIIDSINPCAIGVLVFLLAYLTKFVKKASAVLVHGLVYLGAVFVTYLLAGLFLLRVIQSFKDFSVNAYIAIAAVIGIFGLFELKEYFFPGKTTILGIPPRYSQYIKEKAGKMVNNIFFTAFMGVFVALVELPCTGAVYLAVLSLMSFSGFTMSNMTMLILYNLIFIAPLIVIVVLFQRGMKTETLDKFRNKIKPYSNLLTGILLLVMSIWMFFFILGNPFA